MAALPVAPPPAIQRVNRAAIPITPTESRPVPHDYLFDVAFRRAGMLLWQGRMQTATSGSVRFNQRLQQSSACILPDGRAGSSDNTTSIEFSLSPSFAYGAEKGMRVSVQFERPAELARAGCGGGGMRTVELQSTIQPELNQRVILPVDADYEVDIVLLRDDVSSVTAGTSGRP